MLAGDWLYMQAFRVALEEKNLRVLELLIGLTQQMVEGELLQIQKLGKAVSEAEYYDLIFRKTACLFSISMRLGAVLAGATEAQENNMAAYGRAVGLAFQIVDDVLDLTATEEVLGKPVASDLREGKATLAVIHSIDHGTAADRQAIQRVLDDRSFENVCREQIQQILVRNGSVAYAMSVADRYAEQSRQALGSLARFGVQARPAVGAGFRGGARKIELSWLQCWRSQCKKRGRRGPLLRRIARAGRRGAVGEHRGQSRGRPSVDRRAGAAGQIPRTDGADFRRAAACWRSERWADTRRSGWPVRSPPADADDARNRPAPRRHRAQEPRKQPECWSAWKSRSGRPSKRCSALSCRARAEPFDLVFIDADKKSLPEYLEWSLKLSRPGTVIIVDNVVRDGKVARAGQPDPDIQGVRRMTEMMAANPRLCATAIPTVGARGYDGFAVAVVLA